MAARHQRGSLIWPVWPPGQWGAHSAISCTSASEVQSTPKRKAMSLAKSAKYILKTEKFLIRIIIIISIFEKSFSKSVKNQT